MSNDLIAMDNSIVTSAYNLSVNEQRLIYCALKQMPKYDPKNPDRESLDPKTPFYITRDDFIELGANSDNVAKEIRQATRELMKKSLFVQTTEGIREFHWLSEVLRYDRNAEQKLREKYPNPSDYKKYINALKMYNLIDVLPTHKADDNIVARVVFHEKVIPLLSDLKASFTQFLLSDVTEFSSIYSYRIYQLFMQYLNKETGKGWTQLDFYDLRFMLMLLDKYPLTADFKKRVIDPAIKEINEKSPLKAKYELIKKGRKFVAVKFTFELKEKTKKTKENESRDPNTVDMLSPIKMTDKQRQTFASKLAELRELGDYAPIGMSMKEYAKKIESDLLDPEKTEFYRPYLEKLGFKA
ncbi:replication protein [Moraxella ovis]|uniref:Replication protein n=1 Tax=Moraxella ovis TaxID=29433 RepID=A0A378QCY2_9GAMM|nr:RepB family plasmid replication initiator protein [Moraxella ovis]STY98618.1 replication protein [Moraxella ovis]